MERIALADHGRVEAALPLQSVCMKFQCQEVIQVIRKSIQVIRLLIPLDLSVPAGFAFD